MSGLKTPKPIVPYYEYLRTLDHKGWLDSVDNLVLSVGHNHPIVTTSDKNLIYEHLKNDGASSKTLDLFSKSWELYVDNSGQATREARKQAWDDKCNEYKKGETYLIEHYCGEITGYPDYYDQSFEDREKRNEIQRKYYADQHKRIYIDKTEPEYTNAIIEYANLRDRKPNNMSSEEYQKKLKDLKGQATQLRREHETDDVIKSHTPGRIFHNKVRAIHCSCKAENLRRGIYCKTCKLMLRVDKYMMELFKDAAEGRLGFRI